MWKAFYFRFVIFKQLPAPLKYAANMCWYMQITAKNPRQRERWRLELESQWRRWQTRPSDPVINQAKRLIEAGWFLSSDWPLVPPEYGEALYGIKLYSGGPWWHSGAELEFAWDVSADAKAVPVERVYDLLNLPHRNTDEQLVAWEVCYWLSFLAWNTLHKEAMLETEAILEHLG